jgi:predicted hydrocarbon binding protein
MPKARMDRDIDLYATALRNLQGVTGLPSAKVMRLIGREFGEILADRIDTQKVPEVVNSLNKMMEVEDLGQSRVKSWKPLVLEVSNCLGCERDPDLEGGTVTCPLREGILEAALHRTGKSVKVLTKGMGVGSKACEFEIDTAEPGAF